MQSHRQNSILFFVPMDILELDLNQIIGFCAPLLLRGIFAILYASHIFLLLLFLIDFIHLFIYFKNRNFIFWSWFIILAFHIHICSGVQKRKLCDDSSAIENTIDRYRYLDLFESSRPATNRHMKQRINKQTLIEIFIVYICIVKSKCQTYNEIRGIENIITNWLDIERKKMHRIYRPKNCIQWFIGKKNKNKTITKNMVKNNRISTVATLLHRRLKVNIIVRVASYFFHRNIEEPSTTTTT